MVALEEMYSAIPVVTRVYITLSALLAAAVSFEFLSPFALYLNYNLVAKGQLWRLLTSFLFFGSFSVQFIFNMHFLYFYSRRLEEHYYHRNTSRFCFMLLFGAAFMLAVSASLDIPFLSNSLVMMILYVWARRNPDEHLSLYGLFTVSVPYMPLLMAMLQYFGFGGSVYSDLIGVAAGHVFWYVEDILPKLVGRERGASLIPTPGFIVSLFPDEAEGATAA
eukprot:Rhum_TRINITY_DN8918_c0_g1::Rhum_TRINITY_DN8918_c0_g1_i1::g.30636::m.30636/K13989/DERL2_3; Derlin-2/3